MTKLQDGKHIFSFRVYYEDTDAGGIVYYANFLRFAERARTELLRMIGADHKSLMEDEGVAFTVRSCGVNYIQPAYLDDPLEVHTRVIQIGGASVDMDQSVKRDFKELVRLAVSLACVGKDGKPRRIPRKLRDAIADNTNLSTSQNLTGKRNYN